jgi:tetratricopeptide (TPR) repeat protein
VQGSIAPADGRRDAWIVFVVAAVLRAAYLAAFLADGPLASIRSVDTAAYLGLARQILEGGGAGAAPFHSAAPYPFLLAALGGSATLTLAVQALVDSLSAVLIWRIGRREGRAAGLAGGLLYATAAVAIFAAGTLLFDTVGTFLVLAAVDRATTALERPSVGGWVAAAAPLALAATARPFLAAFLAVTILVPMARGRLSSRAATVTVAGAALGVALALAPLVALQLATVGEVRLLPASGGVTFFIGNNPAADGTLVFPTYRGIGLSAEAYTGGAMRDPARRLGRPVTAGEASAFWFREGLGWWRREPLAAVALTARKAAMLLGAAEIPDNYDFTLARERIGLLRWLPSWLPVLILAPAGVALALRRRRAGPPLAMVGLHAAALPLFLATGRLRYPLMALLCAFAGMTIEEARAQVRAGERRGLLVGLVAAVAAASLALWPFIPADALPAPGALRQLAAALVDHGRPDEALALLARLPPGRGRSTAAVRGDALRALGRAEEALAAYKVAVAFDPGDDLAHRRVEEISAARPADAAGRALAADAQARGDASSWLGLARRRLAEERFEMAVRAARRAVEAGAGDDGIHVLALALRGRGRAAESVEALTALVGRAERDVALRVDLADSLLADGRPEEARARYEEALAIDPAFALAHYGLGRLERLMGHAEAARSRFQQALELAPPGTSIHDAARAGLGAISD